MSPDHKRWQPLSPSITFNLIYLHFTQISFPHSCSVTAILTFISVKVYWLLAFQWLLNWLWSPLQVNIRSEQVSGSGRVSQNTPTSGYMAQSFWLSSSALQCYEPSVCQEKCATGSSCSVYGSHRGSLSITKHIVFTKFPGLNPPLCCLLPATRYTILPGQRPPFSFATSLQNQLNFF